MDDAKSNAKLLDVQVPAMTKHWKTFYDEEELTREATVSKKETVQIEASREGFRLVDFYNLDAIITVEYRVDSQKTTRFRQWATNTLHEYIQKGLVLIDEVLKNGKPFGKEYFDELMQSIRDIRGSERRPD